MIDADGGSLKDEAACRPSSPIGSAREAAAEARAKFRAAQIPTYETPESGDRGLRLFVAVHARTRGADADAAPRGGFVRRSTARRRMQVMAGAAKAGRTMLTEPEAKAVLTAYGIPTVPTRVAARTARRSRRSRRILLKEAPALAVKVLSEDMLPQIRCGRREARAALAARGARSGRGDLRRASARAGPTRGIQGFTVQPMIVRPNAHELLLGVFDDRLFGPVMLFGAGGTASGNHPDTADALAALDVELARDLMQQTRIFKLLKGYRDRPAADLEAIADTLVRLSQLVVDCPSLRELDINPLLADESGVIALDARIRIEPRRSTLPGPNPRLAIRPYPNQWEAIGRNGRRHARADQADPARRRAATCRLSDQAEPEDIRFRFLAPRKEFSHDSTRASRRSTMPAPWPSWRLTTERTRAARRGAARGRPRLYERRIRHHRAQRSQGQRARLCADAPAHPLCRKRGLTRFAWDRARRQ